MINRMNLKAEGGYWDIYESPDPHYPGIDIEFISYAEDELRDDELYTRPRVVIEFPNESSDKMRALIWTKTDEEDYTEEIIFDNCHRIFEKKFYLPLSERNKLEAALHWKDGDPEDARFGEDDWWLEGADFEDETSMIVKILGQKHGAVYAEAALYKYGERVANIGPRSEILGKWEIKYGDDIYRIVIDRR